MVEVVGLETADTLAGTDAADTLTGNGGDDRLDGLAGSDSLFGGAGNDTADGGAGDDSISGGSGDDSLDGDRDTTVTSSDVTTTTTNDPLTISLTVADESNRVFEDISGFVSREAQVSADLNIAYVIDVSGSMGGQFQGSTVGDLNGDGSANTLLDAVIASFSSLNQSLIDAGLGDANIAIVPFASNAQIVFTGRADQDSDQNGVLDVVQVLSALDDGGTTAFDDGLQQAQVFFDAAASGANQVFFISDGLPDSNSFTDESEALRDPAGTNASIRAIGLGNGASLNSLDLLDDGVANNSVERVLDPDALDAGLIDTDVPVSEIDRVEIFVNGVLVTTIDAAQLVETPFGLRFSATVAGLSPAFEDTVAARVVAVDGTTVTTSQVIEVAASNAAGDDTLDGGPGNDTLDGNGGTDTVDYSAGGNLLVSDAELGLQDIGGNAPTLFDGDGFEWDFNSSLSVVDGSNDAFDGGLVLNIVQGGATTPFTPDGELRQSADGRTVAAAGASQDIAIERQVFVPDDAAFARYLETFTNLGSSTQSFSIQVVSDLGSDAGTRVVVQSPVDQGFNAGDRFVISDDAVGGSGDPFVLHYFGDGTGAARPTVGALANDTLFYQFDLTLAPGESVSILHFTSQSQDLTVMGNLLLALEGGATGQLQSMTAADVARVANFDLDPDALVGNPVTVDLEGGQALDPFGALDVLSSIENVIGSPADDAIAGDGGQNRLEGRDGDDALFGRSEDDVLVGGAGDDLLVGDGQENTTTDATVTTIAVDPLTISLTLPDATNDTVVPVSGFVSGEAAVGEAINIAFVIDVSGSMLSGFSGASVGDQDGDGTANTLLDAVIASFVSLNRSLVDAGLQDANVAVIPFSDDATVAEVAAAGFDSDLDGLTDIEEALRALTPGNLTFFDAGLASAIDFFQQAGPGANHVFFISDGVPNGGPFADESAVLRDPAGINATIRGIGLGAGAALDQIDLLDDGLANGSVERVTDPALLDANLQDSGVDAADIARVELLLNGTVVQTIDAGDLTVTPLGLRYAADLGGLDPNAADAVTARVVASDGSTASTSQTVGVLVGDGTGDDTLLGDAGADTLTGNGGDDQLVGGDGADIADGGAGNDEIFGGSDGDLLLGGEGADRIDGDGNLAVTSSDTVTTITTNDPLTINMTVADRSDAATETLTGFVSRDQVVNDDLNIAFVLDRSGSMINSFQGAAVGDVNGDGSANTILDAVIVAVGSLTDSLVDAGLGGASISVIQFDSTAEIIGAGRADADIDGDGVADVNAVLSGIQAGGTTHFDAALAEAIDFFGTVGGGANHVFFLSDGLPNGGPFLDESEILRDPAGINATIRAISLGSGNNLLDLDLLDDGLDNGSVELAADPAALDANLQGADVEVGDIDRVEIRVNGVLQTTIPAAALISTPFGLRFSAQVTGLDIDAVDVVQATLIASDGTSVSTSQTIERDGGAGAGDDLIGGGAGNDTLSGNGGNDTVQGNDDADLLFGGAGDDSLQGNDGNDTLSGGAGDDQQFGGDGNDAFLGSLGNDLVDGGAGTDLLDYSLSAAGVLVDLAAGTASGQGSDSLVSIEQVLGSDFADDLRGSVAAELLSGNAGDDTLAGGAGDDTLSGGTGTDRAVFGFALDPFGVDLNSDGSGLTVSSAGVGEQDALDATFEILEFADITFDLTLAPGGAVVLVGSAANDLIGGLDGAADDIAGRAGDDLLIGDGGNDRLRGEAGDDTLLGGDGDDTLSDGGGTDLLVGGAGSDLFIIGAEDGTTTISGLESGSDLIDLRAFDIFDFDGLLAVSAFPVVAAVDGAPDSIMEVTLGPTRTLVIETLAGPDPQAGDFIFADAPDRPFDAARDLVVADGDWRYSGRTVDKALGDTTSYAEQDWSAPDITTLASEQGFHLAVGDVTGDGNPEIVIAGPSGIRVVDGAGQTVATAIPAATPRDVILEDVDGDGDLEIITGSRGTVNLQINVFDGDGTILQTVDGPAGGSDASNLQMFPVAYLGDGNLAVGFRAGFDRDPRGLAVYDLNDGAEQFLFDTGPEVNGVSVGNLGSDTALDFALSIFTPSNGATGNGVNGTGTQTRDNRASAIVVAEDGSETLVQDVQLAAGGTTSGSVEQIVADLDGDGVNEILLSSGHTPQHPGLTEIQVLSADGTVEHSATTIANAPATLLAHDLDGDGDLEIVVSHGSSQDLRLYDHDLNLLQGRTGIAFSVNGAADVDGDGTAEIIVGDGSALRILSGTDLSDIVAPVELGATISRIVTTDADGDGRADIIATTDGGTFMIQGDAPPPDDSNVIIAPSIPGAIAGTGDSFSFSTIYTNGLGDETTTGVGLRIHFDSSVLTYDQASNVFARSLQPFGQVIEADSQDFDSDPTTDTFVAFNWADLGGNWPGPGNLPQVLLDSTFTVTGNSADTVINYSASSLPNGFGFEATSFQVVADRWPLPDDLSVTEGAANGVVVADLVDGLVLDPNDPGSFTLLDDAGGRFRLDGFVLEVADGGLIDFETATSHDISIRIDSNTGASVARTLTVAVEDAAFQIVTPVVPGVIAGAGDTVVVSAKYTTADPVDATLSGLGLRVHFDSTALSFVGFENLFQTALQPFGQVVEQDTADFDNDAATDSFIATSWADFNQNFPGAETQLLYDLLFTSIGGSDATVNFSVSSVAAGRTFVGESFAVVGDRWPLPDNLAVAENSGDGTLVADLADGLVLDANDPGSFTLLDDAGGRFALSGFELRVANGGGLDFESTASHDITLRIASNTGAVAERTLTIGVTDVNEAPTAVELDNAEVSEAATTGTLVGRLSGEDPEGDAVLFALLDNAGGRFALDGDRIVVAGNGVLDFETAQSHQIRVEARDSAGLTFEDVLTIDVTDVAEATMDLDGDGIQNALSDGLIALGRMFGAPVQQLSGFAASGSPGADTAQLEQRLLEAEAGFFDVDGDGVQNALSDGLIILGRLFGAPASQLASFANPVGSRTSAEEIGSFLDAVDINLALVSAAGTDAVL